MDKDSDIADLINIEVETAWLPEQISKEQKKYAFSYHITITNGATVPVQLLNRYWLITDGDGKQSEVAGPGVVGQTPVIQPGEKFAYKSGAILDTPIGFMQGHYEFSCGDSQLFKAPIDVFTLSVPNTLN
ncbi:Co2+/Mg2+ efflux protein ApaG [Planctobacterium marinum]|uniref:Co2+/Mg2+ efflux protein ApaG n=1 Tax=Planctobacterium marinum TaxID=1631968 RepID=UPI001E4827C4|nr:Co2+/Mg2+ efflux protein ApaG [Planctobacterium marinum]MCC2605123.1 Co2+/Mg2+ efflux protein ApaG [Planctobacterium marinum]